MAAGIHNKDEISTFVAVPVQFNESNVPQIPQTLHTVKNVIIQRLPSGSIYIVEAPISSNIGNVSQSHLDSNGGDTNVQASVLPDPSRESRAVSKRARTKKVKDTIESIKCPKCSEIFDKLSLYKKHILWHRSIKKYKCEKCQAAYNVETNLTVHSAIHAEGKPTCPMCHISFQRLASLKSHLMLHQVEELFTCEECGAEFEREEELNRHIQNHFNNNSNVNKENDDLICVYCKVQFDDQNHYKEHISHHVKVKKLAFSSKKTRKTQENRNHPHKCPECEKSFPKASLLERHVRVHSGEKPYICEVCNKGFNQKGTLQIHRSKHTGIKPFECTLCSAKFNQKGNLRVHVEKTHTAPMPGVKTFKCVHCTCLFKNVASLNVHVTRSHASTEEVGIKAVMSQLQKLERQIGGKTSNSSHDDSTEPADKVDLGMTLDQGREILKEIKKSEGSNVNYVRLAESFTDGTVRRYLVKQKKENDVRLYICNYCTKEFKKPSDLIRHTRMHTKEKPFQCKLCGKLFTLKSSLYAHTKAHNRTARSIHTCLTCGKKFAHARALKRHGRRHIEANNEQFSCRLCNMWFLSYAKLKQHRENHHSNHREASDVQVTVRQPLLQTADGFKEVAPAPARKPSAAATTNRKIIQCHVCRATFTRAANLKRHLQLHTSERRFKCEECYRSFKTTAKLREHSSLHSGMKDYSCRVCGKKCSSSWLLKRHMTIHSNSKPYYCPHCSKNFRSVLLCRKHIKIHKKERTLQLQALTETGEINDLDDSEKEEMGITKREADDPEEDDPQQFQTFQSSEIPVDGAGVQNGDFLLQSNVYPVEPPSEPAPQELAQESSQFVSPSQIELLRQIAGSSIQLIGPPLSDKTGAAPQGSNQMQTIYISCGELQLTPDSNGLGVNNLGSQIRSEGAPQTFFFNALGELQDNAVFNIHSDSLNIDFESLPQSSEMYSNTPAHIFNANSVISADTNELNKILRLANFDGIDTGLTRITDRGVDRSAEDVLPILGDNIMTGSLPFYPSTDLNLLLTELEVQNLLPSAAGDNLILGDINLSEDLAAKFRPEEIKISTMLNETNLESVQQLTECINDSAEAPKNFTCTECNRSFSQKNPFQKHCAGHNRKPQPPQHKCTFCSKTFRKQSDLTRHIRTHTGEKPFACDKCEKKFSLKSTLLSHQKTHNPVIHKTFHCVVCNASFSSKSSLTVHMNSHTGAKPHACNFCPMKFGTAAHRKVHELSQHTNVNKKRPQSKSAKITSLLASVPMDSLNQTDEQMNMVAQDTNNLGTGLEIVVQEPLHLPDDPMNNILCEANPSSLTDSIQLDPMILQQFQAPNFNLIMQDEFIQLDDGFLLNIKASGADLNAIDPMDQNSDLPNSIVLSAGAAQPGDLASFTPKPRDLECDICHKKYSSKEVLRKHKKVHVPKKFPCATCNKSFDVQMALIEHERTHTGHRPYACMYCRNTFCLEKNLVTHLKRIHQISALPLNDDLFPT